MRREVFDEGRCLCACTEGFYFGAEDFLEGGVSGVLYFGEKELTFRRSTVATRLFARSRSATIISTSASLVTTSLSTTPNVRISTAYTDIELGITIVGWWIGRRKRTEMKRDRKRRWKKPYPVSDYDPATWPGSIHSTCADRVVGFWSVIFGVGGLVPCIPIVLLVFGNGVRKRTHRSS